MSELTTATNAIQPNGNLAQLGQAANVAAAANAFTKYNNAKSASTIANHKRALAVFTKFILERGTQLDCIDFQNDPNCWAGVTWGLVEAFVAWEIIFGYAVGTINNHLATVKTYAKLAVKAGIIPENEYGMITTVTGFTRNDGINLDANRAARRIETVSYTINGRQITRSSTKKSDSTPISELQAKQLKATATRKLPNSTMGAAPADKRNALMLALLLDHGLRASELVGLTLASFDFERGDLSFYRPKTKSDAIHKMTADTLVTAIAYRPYMSDDGPVFVGNFKSGQLKHNAPLTRITASRAVTRFGALIGLEKLSAHDCRHYAATYMAKRGYAVNELCEWFGWTNAQTALNYIDAAMVAVRDKG